MGREKHSGLHAADTGSTGRRKKRVVGEHTMYRAPAVKAPVFKTEFKFNRKHLAISGAAVAALLIILFSVLLIHSNKKDYDSYITKAAEFYGNGEYDSALTMLRRARDSASPEKEEECLFFMADCYEAQGNIDKAIEVLKRTDVHDNNTARRIAALEREKAELMEADKLKIAGKQFTDKERTIKLEGKGLEDKDLEVMNRFTGLEKLSLRKNSIKNISALSGLKSLVSLDLSDNRIEDISPLSNLQGLKALYLDNNPVNGLGSLLELKNLSFLSLRGINIRPQQLEKLSLSLPGCSIYSDAADGEGFTVSIGGKTFSSEATELDLSGMGLTNISAVSECRKLQKLNISGNKISDLYAVMNLPELSWLDVSNNVIGDMRPLMGLKNLDTVLASGNRVAATAAFASMDNLKTLDLSDNPIGDFSGFKDLDRIEILCLNNTGLNNEGLENFKKLHTLKRLEIKDNPDLYAEAVDELKARLGGCAVKHSELFYSVDFGEVQVKADAKELNLSSMGLTSITPIAKMEKLETVDLSKNNIDNLYYFQYCLSKFSIKKLNLSSNNISDISVLSELTNLQELDLSNNKITSAAKLMNLKNLRTLNLSGNPIGKEDVDELKLNLAGCKVIFD